MTLPADVARCPGYWADGELREGCDDCLRRLDLLGSPLREAKPVSVGKLDSLAKEPFPGCKTPPDGCRANGCLGWCDEYLPTPTVSTGQKHSSWHPAHTHSGEGERS